MGIGLFVIVALIVGGSYASFGPLDRSIESDEQEITSLAARWVSAVKGRNPVLLEMLTPNAKDYYDQLRHVALYGGASDLEALHPVDQLQVLFLRLTTEPRRLETMSADEIVLRAIQERWIGQDLRRSDELREIRIEADQATGRLYKFGLADRPDRGRQYFRRVEGAWRIDLRGERERLEQDFASFEERSGLARSEAAFFILETRLLRKVTAADFLPPVSDSILAVMPEAAAESASEDPAYRIVSVRDSLDRLGQSAITVADTRHSLRYVLRVGEFLEGEGGYRLVKVSGDRAWLENSRHQMVLDFEPDGPPLGYRMPASQQGAGSLLDQAKLGERREGLMSQWRNIGLRDRAQLLQQGWFVPELVAGQHAIEGLRARKLLPGSFWEQIGITEGDVVEDINGQKIDSMDAWQAFMNIAENAREISVLVLREGQRIRFHTRTIRARPEKKRL